VEKKRWKGGVPSSLVQKGPVRKNAAEKKKHLHVALGDSFVNERQVSETEQPKTGFASGRKGEGGRKVFLLGEKERRHRQGSRSRNDNDGRKKKFTRT